MAAEVTGDMLKPSLGLNPVTLMKNVVGKEGMMTVIQDVLQTSTQFPPLSKDQSTAVQQLVSAFAVTQTVPTAQIQQFLDSFNPEQQTIALKLEEKILKFLGTKFIGPDGGPTPIFLQEAEKAVSEMKNQPNHNNGIFKILQSIVSEGTKKVMKKKSNLLNLQLSQLNLMMTKPLNLML